MMLVKNTDDIPAFLAGDHTYIKEILHPKNDAVQIQYSLAHASLPVNVTSLPHQLKSSEVYYILKGKGKVFINEEMKEVKVGDMIFIPPNATQSIQNTGDEVLEFLCIVHPEWRENEEVIL